MSKYHLCKISIIDTRICSYLLSLVCWIIKFHFLCVLLLCGLIIIVLLINCYLFIPHYHTLLCSFSGSYLLVTSYWYRAYCCTTSPKYLNRVWQYKTQKSNKSSCIKQWTKLVLILKEKMCIILHLLEKT